ncbi:hypothetical protein VP01_1974g3 [Puccinia sorghi]|uniref:Uncharacterized protein n=1 Tax=Puccinia sorghi TaxID=27349 RepID=A0A0L6VBT9_9BASI|nr:hypothetical protein VP01_1974g3 [Puccinia sorghi]
MVLKYLFPHHHLPTFPTRSAMIQISDQFLTQYQPPYHQINCSILLPDQPMLLILLIEPVCLLSHELTFKSFFIPICAGQPPPPKKKKKKKKKKSAQHGPPKGPKKSPPNQVQQAQPGCPKKKTLERLSHIAPSHLRLRKRCRMAAPRRPPRLISRPARNQSEPSSVDSNGDGARLRRSGESEKCSCGAPSGRGTGSGVEKKDQNRICARAAWERTSEVLHELRLSQLLPPRSTQPQMVYFLFILGAHCPAPPGGLVFAVAGNEPDQLAREPLSRPASPRLVEICLHGCAQATRFPNIPFPTSCLFLLSILLDVSSAFVPQISVNVLYFPSPDAPKLANPAP